METPSITHPQLVAALAKPGADILKSLTPEKCALLHFAYCLCPEIGELAEAQSRANQIEECGDVEWYLEGLRAALGGTFNQSELPSITNPNLLVIAAHIADAVKRHIFYEKEIDRRLILDKIATLSTALIGFYTYHGFTREEVIAANINKLRARYEKKTGQLGFSNQAANERADKAGREGFQFTIAQRNNNSEWPLWLHQAWNLDSSIVGALYPTWFSHPKISTKENTVSLRTGPTTAIVVQWGHWIVREPWGQLVVEPNFQPEGGQ